LNTYIHQGASVGLGGVWVGVTWPAVANPSLGQAALVPGSGTQGNDGLANGTICDSELLCWLCCCGAGCGSGSQSGVWCWQHTTRWVCLVPRLIWEAVQDVVDALSTRPHHIQRHAIRACERLIWCLDALTNPAMLLPAGRSAVEVPVALEAAKPTKFHPLTY
jgi:hypothetical protein